MGVWGAGLYSGDFAQDLRSAVRAVARLPFDGDKLTELLCSMEPGAADDSENEDHTTFWLVVADQFAKRGIDCERVTAKALDIIDGGDDLAVLSKLGMSGSGLKKRQKILQDLRLSLVAVGKVVKPRNILKKPQALVMETGDIVLYPTSGGKPINPYFRSKEQMVPLWAQDGWGAAIVVECGRMFDFLAWYRPLIVAMALPGKPDAAQLRSSSLWVLKRPGTCSPPHFRKMELETIGTVPIDSGKFERLFPGRPTGMSETVNDISLANQLSTGPQLRAASIHMPGQPPSRMSGRPYPAISRLDEILS